MFLDDKIENKYSYFYNINNQINDNNGSNITYQQTSSKLLWYDNKLNFNSAIYNINKFKKLSPYS